MKKIKAWAIVQREKPCEANDETYDAWYCMVFRERKDARKVLDIENVSPEYGWTIRPIEITILPKSPRKKK